MVASAVYILDLKGKVIISRDYRGDIPASAPEQFMALLMASEEQGGEDGEGHGCGGGGPTGGASNFGSGVATPIMTHNGTTYIYMRCNNLYRTCTSHIYKYFF